MTATANPPLTESSLDELELELALSSQSGALTEARYDEIIHAFKRAGTPGETMMTLMSFGEPAWREKHIRAPQPV